MQQYVHVAAYLRICRQYRTHTITNTVRPGFKILVRILLYINLAVGNSVYHIIMQLSSCEINLAATSQNLPKKCLPLNHSMD